METRWVSLSTTVIATVRIMTSMKYKALKSCFISKALAVGLWLRPGVAGARNRIPQA